MTASKMSQRTDRLVSEDLGGRTVLIAPNRRVTLRALRHPLADLKPRTKIGRIALALAVQQSIATIQIAATSSYVYA